MLLKMRLYDSVGQRGAGLEIFKYSDFLTKFQYFLWLCWNFSETVRNIKKRFGLGCRNSKVLLKMRLLDSAGQKGTRIGFFHWQFFSQNINNFDVSVVISPERLRITRNVLDRDVELQKCRSKCVYTTL